MRGAIDLLKGFATLLVFPLLPQNYRGRWPWHGIVSDAAAQWIVSILHGVLSAAFWILAFVTYQKEFGDTVAAAMWSTAEEQGDLSKFAGWAGIFGFFAFPFTLKGALAWTYLLDSIARFVSMATSGEHLASVFLAVPLWTYDRGRALLEKGRMDRTYGKASEPDRLFEEGANLLIRSPRPHPEWHTHLTFHYRGRLFRLVSEKDVADGTRRCFEARFVPWPEHDMVRRVVLLAGEDAEEPVSR